MRRKMKGQIVRFERQYKGAKLWLDAHGYVMHYCPIKKKTQPLHKTTMEDYHNIEIDSKRDEVHHIDRNKLNNQIDNLALVSIKAHKRFHDDGNNYIPLSHDRVEEALNEFGSVNKAAPHLGVNHQTLRNRFPDLCEKYQRKSPSSINRQTITIVKKCAKDPDIGWRELPEYGVSQTLGKRICREKKIDWKYRHSSGKVMTIPGG